MKLTQQAFKDVCLDKGSGKAIKQKTINVGVGGNRFLKNLNDDFIGNQPTLFNYRLCLKAKLSLVL